MDDIFKAMMFAEEHHKGHFRKHTNEPYIIHPAEVVAIVSSVTSDPKAIILAWVHDVVEMNNTVSHGHILHEFGQEVASGSVVITDPPFGTRKERKQATILRMTHALAWVQTVKCADMISNVRSIIRLDKEFAKTYVPECENLLVVLTKADSKLRHMLKTIIKDWKIKVCLNLKPTK